MKQNKTITTTFFFFLKHCIFLYKSVRTKRRMNIFVHNNNNNSNSNKKNLDILAVVCIFILKLDLMPLLYAQRVVNKYLTRCAKRKKTDRDQRYSNKRTTKIEHQHHTST